MSLFCDRSQGGVPRVREPRPRSLGTFAIIRKNDRSAIKPASKGASRLPPSVFSSLPVRANQEGKEGGSAKLAVGTFVVLTLFGIARVSIHIFVGRVKVDDARPISHLRVYEV